MRRFYQDRPFNLIIISPLLKPVVQLELRDFNDHLKLEKANDSTTLLRNRFTFKQ
jgi:hypothetical protein